MVGWDDGDEKYKAGFICQYRGKYLILYITNIPGTFVLVCSNGTYMSLSEQEYVCKYQAGPDLEAEDTVAV